jgi:hypothetical protein
MAYLPQPQTRRRAPRVRFPEITPAVLRFQDGRCVTGKLQTVSITGGLLRLQRTMAQGSVAKLMFLIRGGSVLGAAEMLSPVSWELQPFRFLTLYSDDQSRLQSAIQSLLEQSGREHKRSHRGREQMENYRAW